MNREQIKEFMVKAIDTVQAKSCDYKSGKLAGIATTLIKFGYDRQEVHDVLWEVLDEYL